MVRCPRWQKGKIQGGDGEKVSLPQYLAESGNSLTEQDERKPKFT